MEINDDPASTSVKSLAYEGQTCVGPRNHVLDGASDLREGALFSDLRALKISGLCAFGHPCAVNESQVLRFRRQTRVD